MGESLSVGGQKEIGTSREKYSEWTRGFNEKRWFLHVLRHLTAFLPIRKYYVIGTTNLI